MRPALAVLLLLTALLAGCAGGGSDGTGASGSVADGGGSGMTETDGAATLGAAPSWQVGQWWTYDWTIGTQTQFATKSIVVSNTTEGYRVAADAEDDAANHAAFFFHNLGLMDPKWSMHQQAYEIPWYSFPLSDGKTWTAQESNIDFNLQPVSRELTMTATLVNASGAVPAHFTIEQRTADGGLRATYDYRPDLGWFSELKLFDPATPDSAPQVQLKVSGNGVGYTGAYFEAAADFVLNYFALVAPAAGQVATEPTKSFPISAAHTHVLAIVFAFAGGGASAAELVAPDGQHWEAQHAADPNGATLAGNGGVQVLAPAVAGDWRVVFTGASPFAAGGGCFAWGVTVTTGTL
jgi:hypothetical protein